MTTPEPIVIIGIGNEYRSDDGAGLYAARRLGDLNLPGVRTIHGIGDGTDMINFWRDAEMAFIIDSISSGADPGTVLRFDGLTDSLVDDIFTGYSTHAFSVPGTMNLARTLGQLPPKVIIYGIEAQSFSSGQGLSPEVAAAARDVVECIKNEIEDRFPALKCG